MTICFLSAYWNATRAFMILSGMSCFAGIIAGIMSFSHFSSFERFNRSFVAGIMFFVSSKFCLLWIDADPPFTIILTLIITDMHLPVSLLAFFVLLGMAIYTGVTINFLGRRFGDWRFSWSYILGWVGMLMTFFAGEKGERPGVDLCLDINPIIIQQQQ